MMFPVDLVEDTRTLIDQARSQSLMIATAESCTGGLVSALLTDIPGSSDIFERGFVTYSNTAKHQAIGVSSSLLETHGAVSEEVAIAMAQGALANSQAHLTISVTGIAGPDGGTAEKPVGLVHIASAFQPNDDADPTILHEKLLLSGDRQTIRLTTLYNVISLLKNQIIKADAS